MNIILTGMRGTGKTALGERLAASLKIQFVDLDKMIAERMEMSIADLVQEQGWEAFRQAEQQVVEEVSHYKNYVISTGAGALMNEENFKLLKKTGKIVLLTTSLEILAERLEADGNRPALMPGKTLAEELELAWQERQERYYAIADLIYESDLQTEDKESDLTQKVEELKNLLKENKFIGSVFLSLRTIWRICGVN
ncbi:MAG: shikimate kinase [Candidatus Gracilibacteria bacterium]|nr:shikimate kinase [Candidatus Gracilibacteria bacterium]